MKIKVQFDVPNDADYGRIVMDLEDALPEDATNFEHDSED